MPQFQLLLETERLSEWKEHYVAYKELKDVIKKSPSDFENEFASSVKNVSEFYEIKTDQLQNDFMTLLRASSSGYRRGNRVPLLEQDSSFDNVSKHDMRNALVDLYRETKKLENFGILNYTGCVKILKKFDKITKGNLSQRTNLQDFVFAPSNFSQSKLCALQNNIEQSFAFKFTNANREIARGMLLAKRSESRWESQDWRIFSLGLRLGVMILLGVWFIWDCFVDAKSTDASSKDDWDTKIDRPLLLIKVTGATTLMWWLWCLNIYVWTQSRVHFMFVVYILELQQTGMRQIKYRDVADSAINLTIGFLITLIVYFKVMRGEFFTERIPKEVYVYLHCVFVLYHLFRLPKILWTTVYHCLVPIFPSHVRFRDTMMGDLLTSLVKVFVDIVTYVGGNDVNLGIVAMLSAVPLLIRLIQNLVLFRYSGQRWPYLGNAVKYAAAEVVVMFGTFHATRFNGDGDQDADDPDQLTAYRFIFIFFSALSTLYTYSWDIRMDWRLGKCKHKGLRFRMLYTSKSFYYVAIILDAVLRFLWVVSLAPKGGSTFFGTTSFYLDPFLGALEISRRGMWSIIRMESQQISNHTSFRSLGTIPMSFATRSRTMDLEADALESEALEEEVKQDEDTFEKTSEKKKSGWCCFRTTSNSLIEIVVFVCLVLTLTVLSVL
eukprot:g3971.t1